MAELLGAPRTDAHGGVVFDVWIDDRRVRFSLGAATIHYLDPLHSRPTDGIDVFRRHQSSILSIAMRIYRAQVAPDVHGSIELIPNYFPVRPVVRPMPRDLGGGSHA
ncbi:MAG: hypothetical protein QM639_14800 [Rhodocyclaceae bacterium]